MAFYFSYSISARLITTLMTSRHVFRKKKQKTNEYRLYFSIVCITAQRAGTKNDGVFSPDVAICRAALSTPP